MVRLHAALLLLPLSVLQSNAKAAVKPPSGEFAPVCKVGSGIYQPEKAFEIPWFTIDLDAPPREHYKAVVSPYVDQIKSVIDNVKDVAHAFLGTLPLFELLEGLAGDAFETNKLNKGIADATGVSVADVTLMNLFYELSRFCTSLVAQAEDGQLYHARNLDFGQYFRWNETSRSWGLTDSLKAITVNLRFIKNGKLLFRGTTFAGHLGVLTAMKPDAFTITMNSRTKADAKSLLQWLLTDQLPNEHFAMWVEREVMEQTNTYEEARQYISTIPQIASCYYILGGSRPGEGAIIVRNETGVVMEKTLAASEDEWFLLQTNYDPDKEPGYLDDRRDAGLSCMRKMGQKGLSKEALYEVLSSTTNLNKGTVHTVVMSVNTGLYEAFIAHCADPCWYL